MNQTPPEAASIALERGQNERSLLHDNLHPDQSRTRDAHLIYARWEAYAKESGKQTSSADFNAYLRFNADHIYTRAQLKDLFVLFGKDDPEKAVQHIVSKERSGRCFEKLFTEREIRSVIKSMIDALTKFIDS